MIVRRKMAVWLLPFVLGVTVPVVEAPAHKGATGVVKQRMELMKSIAKNMKVLDLMMRAQAAYDPKLFRASAAAIQGHAGDAITRLFPKGSTGHPSEATAKIWQDWNRFETTARRLATYAAALGSMAAAGLPTKNGRVAAPPRRGSGSMSDLPPLTADGFLRTEHVGHVSPHIVFRFMAKTCKSCHESFREKKN